MSLDGFAWFVVLVPPFWGWIAGLLLLYGLMPRPLLRKYRRPLISDLQSRRCSLKCPWRSRGPQCCLESSHSLV